MRSHGAVLPGLVGVVHCFWTTRVWRCPVVFGVGGLDTEGEKGGGGQRGSASRAQAARRCFTSRAAAAGQAAEPCAPARNAGHRRRIAQPELGHVVRWPSFGFSFAVVLDDVARVHQLLQQDHAAGCELVFVPAASYEGLAIAKSFRAAALRVQSFLVCVERGGLSARGFQLRVSIRGVLRVFCASLFVVVVAAVDLPSSANRLLRRCFRLGHRGYFPAAFRMRAADRASCFSSCRMRASTASKRPRPFLASFAATGTRSWTTALICRRAIARC